MVRIRVNLFSPYLSVMRALPVGERLRGWDYDLFWAMLSGEFGKGASKNK